MRLFIGIELPDVLKNTVAAVASRVREDIARAAPEAQIRWVPPANLHITVWFLGEVREPRVEPLVASLTPPLDARSFTLRIGEGGAFPQSGAPRAIWLGLRVAAKSSSPCTSSCVVDWCRLASHRRPGRIPRT